MVFKHLLLGAQVVAPMQVGSGAGAAGARGAGAQAAAGGGPGGTHYAYLILLDKIKHLK